jgi:uncharacterized protein (TIGR03083 family)
MHPMQVAEDFRTECRAIHALLAPLEAARYEEATLFKGWTANAVLQHLCFWNEMACKQLEDEAGLVDVLGRFRGHPGGMRGFESEHFKGLGGPQLLERWRLGRPPPAAQVGRPRHERAFVDHGAADGDLVTRPGPV